MIGYDRSVLVADQLYFTKWELLVWVFRLFHNGELSEYFDGRLESGYGKKPGGMGCDPLQLRYFLLSKSFEQAFTVVIKANMLLFFL